MRWPLAAVLLAGGCDGEAKVTTTPTPTSAAARPTGPVSEPAPVPARPAGAQSRHRGLVLANGELFHLAPNGQTQLLARAPAAEDCKVDAAHRVVWLKAKRGLSAFDLTDRKVKEVARVPVDVEFFQITYGSMDSPFPREAASTLGEWDCVALRLDVGARPRLMGQGNDLAPHNGCLQNEGTPRERLAEASHRKLAKAYGTGTITNPGYVVKLHERRVKMGVRRRGKQASPAAPRVRVDKSRCEDGDTCGEATYVGGNRVWWIETDNSFGDFGHYFKQLYDAKTAEYWDPRANKRAKQPFSANWDEEEGVLLFEVSPDAKWAVYTDKVLDLEAAAVAATYRGKFCGFKPV